MMLRKLVVLLLMAAVSSSFAGVAAAYDIGAYYYPGWDSTHSKNWVHITGAPGSKSPGRSFPERMPLIGYYPEEQQWVADKQLQSAASYGIDFFAYQWFWGVSARRPNAEHAINNHLRSPHREKVRFCIMWANHWQLPDPDNYRAMVSYWIENYFDKPNYYRIDGKPVIFIFSPEEFSRNAAAFGKSSRELLQMADEMARKGGHGGIYFVAESFGRPGDSLASSLKQSGYDAYSGWNYVAADNKPTADYSSMVDTYLDYYAAASASSGTLPYIASASPGWDATPIKGDKPFVWVRENSTPAKFKRMLQGAKKYMDQKKSGPSGKILMIMAWNEFAEGAYLEPTKKWGYQYLEAVREVFGK